MDRYFISVSSTLDAHTLVLKSHLYSSKSKVHELSSVLSRSKTPFFDLMVTLSYIPLESRPENKEIKPLTLEDIFFPPLMGQLTSTVENLMLIELRNFCTSLFLDAGAEQHLNLDQMLMLVARRFLGKDLRKMHPIEIVGERALEEKEKKGRTASVMALSPCE